MTTNEKKDEDNLGILYGFTLYDATYDNIHLNLKICR